MPGLSSYFTGFRVTTQPDWDIRGRTALKSKSWLDVAEYASLLGLGVGSVASVVSSQFMYATAPLSVLALLNLANRRRWDAEVEKQSAIALNTLDQKTSKHVELLNQQIQALPTPEILAGLKKSLLIKDREILGQLSGQIEALRAEVNRQVMPLQQLELGHLPEEVAQLRAQYKQLSEAAEQLRHRLAQTTMPEQSAEQERAIVQVQNQLERLRTDLQKLTEHTKPNLARLQDQINHIHQRLQKLPPPFDATTLQREVEEMVRVVAELVPRRDWTVLLQEIQALQNQQESLTAVGENLHRQVQELNQQLQERPTKASIASLQNQLNQVNRQIQELPPPFDPAMLRQKLAELVKDVADRVPQQDFSKLVAQLRALQQQQVSQSQSENQLRREVQTLQQQLEPLLLDPGFLEFATSGVVDTAAIEVPTAPVQTTSERLQTGIPVVIDAVHPQEDTSTNFVPNSPVTTSFASGSAAPSSAASSSPVSESSVSGVAAPLSPAAATPAEPYLPPAPPIFQFPSDFDQAQAPPESDWLSYLLDQLHDALEQVRQRLQNLPVEQEYQSQVEAAFRYELQVLNQQWQETGNAELFELIFDGQSVYHPAHSQQSRGAVFTGLAVLEAALETARDHLTLVLPWSAHQLLDESLLNQLEHLLSQNCRLDLGWCHFAEPTTPRFLTPISQRWHLQSFQQGKLQDTLRRLLHLKRIYPNLLQFKILGIRESFLVMDDQLAIVGLNQAIPELAIFPELGMKLQTTDQTVVQHLLNWFECPTLEETDTVALWNRATTYYDLCDRPAALADLERLLALTPDDALAYNFRGVVRYDLGDRQGALADFNQALEISPRLILAYCNRGFLHSELGDQLDAIADFNAALRLNPNFALAHFYRGVACQKFGELSVAIQNYDEAIRLAPNAAPAFYYRGMAHVFREEHLEAISDLERAAHLFDGEHSPANAEKARAQLEKLWRAVGDQKPAKGKESNADLAGVSG